MPLMRVEVRNEYGLGSPEIYEEAGEDEPKEILEGVAVAGLVGVLRLLGDLVDFAGEVFHGLQEEVMTTCSRSRELMSRVQHIEAALVPVERALLAQQSHVHFAYCAGLNWHAPVGCENHHFVYNDMPQFIFNSYEDCRSPPHFHLLDRFDLSGPGSCLRRYSDPTVFINASETSGDARKKVARDMQLQMSEKHKSWPRNGEESRGASFAYRSARMQFPQSNIGGLTSSHSTVRSDLHEQSNSDQRNESGCSKDGIHPSYSMQTKEQQSGGFISPPEKIHGSDECDYNLTQEQGVCSPYSDTWAAKIAEHETKNHDHDTDLESFIPRLYQENLPNNAYSYETVDRLDVQTCTLVKTDCGHESLAVFPESCSSGRLLASNVYNAVSSVDKSLMTAQMTGDALYTSSKKSISGNGGITDSKNEESVSCRVSSKFKSNGSGMPIIGDTKSCYDPEKHLPETSDVTSPTFWTNGGLLGLQPSKPPLCSVLPDLPQHCLSKEDWKSSSTQHVIFHNRDPQKPDETNSFLNIDEGLDMDCFTCLEYQENDESVRHQTFPGQLSEGVTLIQSPPSSPLLAHMKISVQPMGGFKTSKLKLKFMDGNIIDRGSIDVFPSFQLVPTVFNTQLNVGSDSDDDTLSGSSPSLADDFHHHHSEQREPSRPPGCEDLDLHDSLSRISLAGSVSTIQEKGGSSLEGIHENCGHQVSSVEHSMQSSCSLHPFHLQSLDINNPWFEKELKKQTNSKDPLQPEFATFDPPPLPPEQWWATKPHLEASENSCDAVPKALDSGFDLKHSSSSTYEQNLETTYEQESKPFSSEKLNSHREANQGKNIDENNFLNQIRRQSLSLRPTVPAKPIVPPRTSTNVRVTTILEKANAIRQAVGSDDGDNWSDS